jgi:polyhydroxyalkanoate synthesis regulator protein
MEWLVPRYLEFTMKSFARNQEQLTKSVGNGSSAACSPSASFEEMGKQNMALFEKAMKMFTPFGADGEPMSGETLPATAEAPVAAPAQGIQELTDRLNSLQGQLDALTKKGTKSGA